MNTALWVPFHFAWRMCTTWLRGKPYDHHRQTFRPLVADAAPNVWDVSTEQDESDGMSWRDVEERTATMAHVTVGSFEGESAGGRRVDVHYRLYDAFNEQHGGVVVVTGFTEAVATYQEVIHDFVRNGFSVYGYDHRGHGFSSRLLSGDANADIGHVDTFDHLVDDLERFITLVQARRGSGVHNNTLHILANSMGGTIASLYLSRGTTPVVSSVAMIAPMHRIQLSAPAWLLLASRILWLLMWILPFTSSERIHGGDFATERAKFESKLKLSDNEMSHSMARLRRRWTARSAQWTDARGECHDARISGRTVRWLVEAYDASCQSRVPTASNAQCRQLILQAENDNVVDADGQVEYAHRVNAMCAGGCTAFCVAQARHLILHEVDEYRNPALRCIMSFFCATSPPT